MLKREPFIIGADPEHPQPVRKRRSGAPEQSAYVDTGCELAASCLDCPLARCKYDDPRWRQRNDLKTRDARIVELRQAGRTVKEVAKEIGVSDRTAYRVLLREKRRAGSSNPAEFAKATDPDDEAPVMSLEELDRWRPVTAYPPAQTPARGVTR